MIDITQNLKLFVEGGVGKNKGLRPDERSASFDYCFNYFQSFREEDKIEKLAEPSHMEMSCESLRLIKNFYEENKTLIDGKSKQYCTLDYATGHPTRRKYTKAKIIDMVGNIEGLNKTLVGVS